MSWQRPRQGSSGVRSPISSWGFPRRHAYGCPSSGVAASSWRLARTAPSTARSAMPGRRPYMLAQSISAPITAGEVFGNANDSCRGGGGSGRPHRLYRAWKTGRRRDTTRRLPRKAFRQSTRSTSSRSIAGRAPSIPLLSTAKSRSEADGRRRWMSPRSNAEASASVRCRLRRLGLEPRREWPVFN